MLKRRGATKRAKTKRVKNTKRANTKLLKKFRKWAKLDILSVSSRLSKGNSIISDTVFKPPCGLF